MYNLSPVNGSDAIKTPKNYKIHKRDLNKHYNTSLLKVIFTVYEMPLL